MNALCFGFYDVLQILPVAFGLVPVSGIDCVNKSFIAVTGKLGVNRQIYGSIICTWKPYCKIDKRSVADNVSLLHILVGSEYILQYRFKLHLAEVAARFDI